MASCFLMFERSVDSLLQVFGEKGSAFPVQLMFGFLAGYVGFLGSTICSIPVKVFEDM